MKAAVLHHQGSTPIYEDFPDPTPGEDELLVTVKAVALENVDKAMANGSHYASQQFLPKLPAIVGFDGIGMLEDGKLIGFGGIKPPYGAMAEKVVIPRTHQVPIPDGIEAAIVASVPGSALTAFSLKFAAKIQPGETVLINGATGFSGRLAIQVARLLGAGRIVCAGRHDESLRSLQALGADTVIDLKQPDAQLADTFTREAGTGYDIILDFVWGHPTEVLIKALTPHELVFNKRIRLIQIGEAAGSTIALAADSVRTSGLEIYGGATGITAEGMSEAANQVMEWIREGKLQAEIERVPLKDIENAWKRTDLHGKRIVIIP
jgi:NADPH:quinone reductase-like Zn-dependent oxidoreductase